MNPEREVIVDSVSPKTLVGMCRRMSLAQDSTAELWRAFMPRRGEVAGRSDDNFYSLQRYDAVLVPQQFSASTEFEKWAAVEVNGETPTPPGMQRLELDGGLYAVFLHIGPANSFAGTWRYIFEQWLPASDYQLDHREHFEILPPGYRPDDPQAREQVFVPISKHGD